MVNKPLTIGALARVRLNSIDSTLSQATAGHLTRLIAIATRISPLMLSGQIIIGAIKLEGVRAIAGTLISEEIAVVRLRPQML